MGHRMQCRDSQNGGNHHHAKRGDGLLPQHIALSDEIAGTGVCTMTSQTSEEHVHRNQIEAYLNTKKV